MNSIDALPGVALDEPGRHPPELSIPQLVAAVYECAPAVERGHLLEQLLRPLGALSLVAVAGGTFAMVRFRGGWSELHVRPEDIQSVRAAHVIDLVEHAQQVSIEAVDGLALMIAASPLMSSSAVAAMLVTLLVQRARRRRGEDSEVGRVLQA